MAPDVRVVVAAVKASVLEFQGAHGRLEGLSATTSTSKNWKLSGPEGGVPRIGSGHTLRGRRLRFRLASTA